MCVGLHPCVYAFGIAKWEALVDIEFDEFSKSNVISQSKPIKTLRLYSPTFLLPNFPSMQCINVNIQEFTVDYCISVYVIFVLCVRS